MTERARFGLKQVRRALARLPPLGRIPEAPQVTVREPWPGIPERGARLLKGELEIAGLITPVTRATFADTALAEPVREAALGFVWLRDLRALGTDPARLRARTLVADAMAIPPDPVATQPHIVGTRLAAWLANYEFYAASAEDNFRQKLMAHIIADARALAAALPAETLDRRGLAALKGLVAVAVAVPELPAFMTRVQRFLPAELARQIAADGTQVERSPAAQLAVLADMLEIRALFQASRVAPPLALAAAIERASLALRALRHADGALALFNGTREHQAAAVERVLAQVGRGGRPANFLPEGRFHRLTGGKTLVLVDAGAPPPPGLDRTAHAGTLSFELSIGRERLIVNCGAMPPAPGPWRDALRATAAHSTLTIADMSSSELRPDGLGRRPAKVEATRHEANGAHWLELSHDGWHRAFNAIHRRKLYISPEGDTVAGEDSIEAPEPLSYTLRFHLHPGVTASLQQDGAALLRLPSGGFWRLRADALPLAIEESIYFGAELPRRGEQIVLTGFRDSPQRVEWAITRVSP